MVQIGRQWEKVGDIMFMGQYNVNIDDKNRLIIPAKYRNKVANNLVIARGLDGCLSLYPQEKWDEIAEKLNKLPTSKKQARAYARALLSSASDVELDSKGRLNVPENLRELASLTKNCLIIGVGDYMEIWDENKWCAYNQDIDETFEEIAEGLEDFEL